MSSWSSRTRWPRRSRDFSSPAPYASGRTGEELTMSLGTDPDCYAIEVRRHEGGNGVPRHAGYVRATAETPGPGAYHPYTPDGRPCLGDHLITTTPGDALTFPDERAARR